MKPTSRALSGATTTIRIACDPHMLAMLAYIEDYGEQLLKGLKLDRSSACRRALEVLCLTLDEARTMPGEVGELRRCLQAMRLRACLHKGPALDPQRVSIGSAEGRTFGDMLKEFTTARADETAGRAFAGRPTTTTTGTPR